MSTEFYWIALALVLITSTARLTRLITWDHFPPIKWLRDKYADWTDGSSWQLLGFCGYCASFWLLLIVVALGVWAGAFTPVESFSDLNNWALAWWLVNLVFGFSYL